MKYASVELYYSPAGRVDDLAGEGNNCFMNPKSAIIICTRSSPLSPYDAMIAPYLLTTSPARRIRAGALLWVSRLSVRRGIRVGRLIGALRTQILGMNPYVTRLYCLLYECGCACEGAHIAPLQHPPG